MVRLYWSPRLNRARAERFSSLVRKLSFDTPEVPGSSLGSAISRKSLKFAENSQINQKCCGPGQVLPAAYHIWYVSYHIWYAMRRVACANLASRSSMLVLWAHESHSDVWIQLLQLLLQRWARPFYCERTVAASLCRTRDGVLRFLRLV